MVKNKHTIFSCLNFVKTKNLKRPLLPPNLGEEFNCELERESSDVLDKESSDKKFSLVSMENSESYELMETFPSNCSNV